jgi:hypothetical protein
MEHIGIALGGKDSQVCVRNAAGEILEEARCPTRLLGEFLASRPAARVVVETCTETRPGVRPAIARARTAQ